MTKQLIFKLSKMDVNIAKTLIMDTIRKELERLQALKEKLVSDLRQLAKKYKTTPDKLELALSKIKSPEADADWIEYKALVEILNEVEQKLKILSDLLESNPIR